MKKSPIQTAILPVAAVISLLSHAAANPVEVPFFTNFSTEFGDFYAPTGSGYNWGHECDGIGRLRRA